MKVVINKCYGGFGLSPEALVWLHKHKCEGLKVYTIEEYYGKNTDNCERDLQNWHKYKANKEYSFFFAVFTPDEKCVLSFDGKREDPVLVQCVEKLGSKKVSSLLAQLKVVEIPDGIKYYIDDYDGIESINEKHASWG